MTAFWIRYTIVIAFLIALEVYALVKWWRVQLIRRKQALRARREILRSIPVEARFRKVGAK